MWFWVFISICNLIIPLTMIIFGISFEKNPPKTINNYIGYRTKMSMKSKETWIFAHKYLGLIWKKVGIILLILSTISAILTIKVEQDALGMLAMIVSFIQIAVMLLTIYPIERALKINFDSEGNPRKKE